MLFKIGPVFPQGISEVLSVKDKAQQAFKQQSFPLVNVVLFDVCQSFWNYMSGFK